MNTCRPSRRKSTIIRVVDSDQVIQHILPLEKVERQKWKRKKVEHVLTYHQENKRRSKEQYYDSSEDLDSEDVFETPIKEPVHAEDNDSLSGQEVFKFRSLKKKGQMAVKAETIVSIPTHTKNLNNTKGSLTPSKKTASGANTPIKPLTPSSKHTPQRVSSRHAENTPTKPLTPSSKQTPQRIFNQRASKSEPLTPVLPKTINKLHPHLRAEATTPYRLRKRNEVNDEVLMSSSDDSVDDSSSEEEDEENTCDNTHIPARKRKNFEGANTAASAENYFDLHSMNSVTSDRTLSNLERSHMDLATIRDSLRNVKASHPHETSALMEKHKCLFDRWMVNMCNGFNILLHGLGSKRALLDSFRESHLLPFSHIVINGYFPGLTVKHILNSITEDVLEESKGFTNIFKQIGFIEDAFKKNEIDFFMVINNIDGVLLRSDKAQNVLSLLATIRGFHLIASIDHINAPLLWNEIQYYRYHWLWYDTPTFQHYEAENSYENSLMIQQSGSQTLSSLVHVMKSLTPNAKRIFLLLSDYQLNAVESSLYDGMSFQSLYQKCREDFLVNSDLTLQAQLIEFKDHRLIRSKKNIDGIEHLTIPVDKVILKEFLHQHNKVGS